MEDLLLDVDKDLTFANNDLVMGESTEQHQYLLLVSMPGDFKETPSACIGAARWLKDEDTRELLSAIKSGFEKDGMAVRAVTMTDNKITTDASY